MDYGPEKSCLNFGKLEFGLAHYSGSIRSANCQMVYLRFLGLNVGFITFVMLADTDAYAHLDG